MLCCPITGQVKGYPFEVRISANGVAGVALADQIKSLDWSARRAQYQAAVAAGVMREVLAKAMTLLSPSD